MELWEILAIKDDGNRTIVDQSNLHHGPKHSAFDRNPQSLQGFFVHFDKRGCYIRERSRQKTGSPTFADIGIQGELGDNQSCPPISFSE